MRRAGPTRQMLRPLVATCGPRYREYGSGNRGTQAVPDAEYMQG